RKRREETDIREPVTEAFAFDSPHFPIPALHDEVHNTCGGVDGLLTTFEESLHVTGNATRRHCIRPRLVLNVPQVASICVVQVDDPVGHDSADTRPWCLGVTYTERCNFHRIIQSAVAT